MNILGFDTSTSATTVCVLRSDGEAFEFVPPVERLSEPPGHARELMPAVAEVVRQQAEASIDIPSDGEFGKRGWTSYVAERLGGLESIPGAYSTLITGMAGTQQRRPAAEY